MTLLQFFDSWPRETSFCAGDDVEGDGAILSSCGGPDGAPGDGLPSRGDPEDARAGGICARNDRERSFSLFYAVAVAVHVVSAGIHAVCLRSSQLR
jgi:hypothetical protein